MDLVEIPISPSTRDNGKHLAASVKLINDIIDQEISAGMDPKKIIIGGFSQGGALALVAAIKYPLQLGGCVVFSGWALAKQNLGEAIQTSASKTTPFFIGHGMSDNVVTFGCAQQVHTILTEGGCPHVTFKPYAGMAHCSCAQQSVHLQEFLTEVMSKKTVLRLTIRGGCSLCPARQQECLDFKPEPGKPDTCDCGCLASAHAELATSEKEYAAIALLRPHFMRMSIDLIQNKSVEDTMAMKLARNEFTYGEVHDLTFLRFLNELHSTYGKRRTSTRQGRRRGVFYDLGCGVGKPMFVAAVSDWHFERCVGVELLPQIMAIGNTLLGDVEPSLRKFYSAANASGSSEHGVTEEMCGVPIPQTPAAIEFVLSDIKRVVLSRETELVCYCTPSRTRSCTPSRTLSLSLVLTKVCLTHSLTHSLPLSRAHQGIPHALPHALSLVLTKVYLCSQLFGDEMMNAVRYDCLKEVVRENCVVMTLKRPLPDTIVLAQKEVWCEGAV
jgi:predicted esterase